MNSLTTSPEGSFQFCKHCGKPLAVGSPAAFCCSGCETAFGIDPLEFWNQVPARGGTPSVTIYVEGIHCSSCVTLLEHLPHELPQDVAQATFDLSHSLLHVTLTPKGKASVVGKKLKTWGYTPHLIKQNLEQEKFQKDENRKQLLDLGVAGALAGNIMIMSIPLYSGVNGNLERVFEGLSFLLAIPSLFYSGRSFLKNTWNGIKNKNFSIDAPIALALVVAFFYSTVSFFKGTHQLYFDSLSGLIFLLLGSRYLLSKLRLSSSLNLDILQFIKRPFTGKMGETITPIPGDVLAFDGILRAGSLWVDASKFSGESDPVHLKAGDSVFAGTEVINQTEDARIEVTAIQDQTRLATLLKKAEEFRLKKTRIEIVSDQLAKGLLAVVTVVGLGSLFYFLSQGMGQEAWTRFLALLIVTCPCALALATPLVLTMACKRLLTQGILVKDPESLDHVLSLKQICFDKTGTLTLGQLTVTDIKGSLTPIQTSVLLAMTQKSRHPVSRAITQAIRLHYPDLLAAEITLFKEIPGRGLEAHHLGNIYTFEKNTFKENQHVLIEYQFSDQLRPESKQVVQQLKQKGYQACVLTGDHVKNATHALNGIPELTIYAGLSPEQKAEHVKDSMMIGDGVNDALALSCAKVSFAVQGGMEAAIQSSQVYSMKPGLGSLTTFFHFATLTRSCLITNFIISTGYNIFGATLALSGNLTPLAAAILMPLSATSVFLMTLYRFREETA